MAVTERQWKWLEPSLPKPRVRKDSCRRWKTERRLAWLLNVRRAVTRHERHAVNPGGGRTMKGGPRFEARPFILRVSSRAAQRYGLRETESGR